HVGARTPIRTEAKRCAKEVGSALTAEESAGESPRQTNSLRSKDRVTYLDVGERHRAGVADNDLVAERRIVGAGGAGCQRSVAETGTTAGDAICRRAGDQLAYRNAWWRRATDRRRAGARCTGGYLVASAVADA